MIKWKFCWNNAISTQVAFFLHALSYLCVNELIHSLVWQVNSVTPWWVKQKENASPFHKFFFFWHHSLEHTWHMPSTDCVDVIFLSVGRVELEQKGGWLKLRKFLQGCFAVMGTVYGVPPFFVTYIFTFNTNINNSILRRQKVLERWLDLKGNQRKMKMKTKMKMRKILLKWEKDGHEKTIEENSSCERTLCDWRHLNEQDGNSVSPEKVMQP